MTAISNKVTIRKMTWISKKEGKRGKVNFLKINDRFLVAFTLIPLSLPH